MQRVYRQSARVRRHSRGSLACAPAGAEDGRRGRLSKRMHMHTYTNIYIDMRIHTYGVLSKASAVL